MPCRYFNLRSPYQLQIGKPQWVIDFPGWLESEFELHAPDPLQQRWNPRIYAFTRDCLSEGRSLPRPDFPSHVGEWHIASQKMQQVIETVAPGSIEFLPFRTRNSVGEDVTDGYSVMHYLRQAPAIHRKASRLMEGETRLRRMAGLARDYLLDYAMFSRNRLTEPICRIVGWSAVHAYREDIVEALSNAGISGLTFEELELV